LLRLWDVATVKTRGTIQKKELIKVLYTGSLETAFTIQARFFPDKEAQAKFFLHTLCRAGSCDYANFCPEEFDLFQVFFRSYNMGRGSIRWTSPVPRVKDPEYEGKSALWDIFACVKDTKVLDTVSNLLVILHTNVQQSRMQQVQQELMDKCLSYISSASACPTLTSRCINLILLLFRVF
jgi:hypothetical protein